MGWKDDVWAKVTEVPKGRVAAYGDVAAALGHPLRARQVGTALAALDVVRARAVPWQRVVNAKGYLSIRGAFAAKDTQRAMLRHEGVAVDDAFTVIDFAAVRFRFDVPDGECAY